VQPPVVPNQLVNPEFFNRACDLNFSATPSRRTLPSGKIFNAGVAAMKITDFNIAYIALIAVALPMGAHSQSIASSSSISPIETPVEHQELEELWKITVARSPKLQSLSKNLNGDRDRLLSTVLCNAEESIAGQLLGMTPRGTIVGTFCLTDPYIEPAPLPPAEPGKDSAPSIEYELTPDESQKHLLTVLRQHARKLVASYRDYITYSRALSYADGKLRCRVRPPEENESSTTQSDCDAESAKVQREIDCLVDNWKRSRTGLTELVGAGALRRLNERLNGPDSLPPVDQNRHMKKSDEDFVEPAQHNAGTG